MKIAYQTIENTYVLLINTFTDNNTNTLQSFNNLRNSIHNLPKSDQEVINYILEVADIFNNYFLTNCQTETKALEGLSCNLAYHFLGTITSTIWGAAFAGPVGVCVGAAWGLASTIVAYYEC